MRQLKRGLMQQRLALPAKFYITKIGHNLGDLHAKTLKVPKLPQFTLDTGRRVTHDGMPYDLLQGQGQGHGASEVLKIALFQVHLLRHLQ